MPTATITQHASAVAAPGLRGRRARALAFDLAAMTLASLVAGAAALAWLLVRTSAGAVDPGRGDSAVALALALSALPAWYAFAALEVAATGATPGQRRSGVTVEGSRAARLVRFAGAPVALPGWWWLAALGVLSGVWTAALLLTSAALIVSVATGVSAVLIGAGRRGLHDRLAGTEVVRP